MAWFSLAKIAMQAGAKIYLNRQKTKMAMSDAQLMHAEKMARGEETYQGKLLEARQNQRKEEEGQERLDLDKMKAMMNKEIQEDKLEQNEQLAGLRAGVSLAKQQMSDASKIHDFGRNFGKK